MTSLDKADSVSATGESSFARSATATEFIETIKLALPIALTQLGQIAMMTTDLALIGRLGDTAVAAASLAHTVFFVAFVIGMGLVSAVAPLAAQALGARQPRIVRRALRVGLWAALMLCIPMMMLPLFGEQILLQLGQAPENARLAQRYLLGLAPGMAPALCFMAIRNFMGAVNRPEPGLWITLAAIPANAVLGYALIHGHWGMPKLELLGAGVATTTVNFGMCAAALWFTWSQRPFKKFQVLGRFWRIDWPLMRQLVIIGAPIAVSFLLEYGLFSAAGLLMGLISTTALAAHQIALQIAAVLFMVPFGIGMAATVRVGHALGRGDVSAIRRAGVAAIVLGIAFMTTMTLAVIVMRFDLAGFFFGDTRQGLAAVELAATLMLVGATFFIADGIQTVAAGALRGLSDTRIPLLLAAISYWLIGFTAAYGLAFWAGSGAIGVWIGLSIGTGIYAILLVLRFRTLTQRLRLQHDRSGF
ncbi:MATE family efflux transporter [Afipia birgiae]|jgi:MATE family multidrug resistance protein|uniref:MATE family efflux transporter n=1 Tax=Afipia birgiae TaxID=151414 RepID=UPI00031ECB4E|nr:MATE family efflux transporter [Afipia birgiae]MBX9820419.1 MATE family efflux transporter [Afipia birgiae]